MKKKIIIITILLAILACFGFVLSKNKKEIDKKNVSVDRSNIPVAVTVIKLTKEVVEGSFELPATIEPSKKAEVSVTTAGRITSLNVVLGSRVKAGQVLGAVDSRQQQINLSDAKDALNKAQRDYDLQKELFAGNAGTGQSVKDAQRVVESARYKLSQLTQQIGDARITAPISGIVSAKTGEVGEYINPGTSIATVVDVYNLKAVVYVSEKDVYKLHLNQTAALKADVLPGKSFAGKVNFISPVGDDNHNYRVELIVNNQSGVLKAGTYIKINFNLGDSSSVLQIPKTALVEGTKNPFVYVVENGKAQIKKIVIGREFGEKVEVLSGLAEGASIIVSGQINLAQGSKIEINK